MRARAAVDRLLTTIAVAVAAGCAWSETTQPAEPLTLDITIAHDTVNPTNTELRAIEGQPIVLRVNSDVSDELHVHSVPDHTFTVEPRAGQSFQFSTDVPGRIEVELHHLHRTVATIHVEP